MLYRLEKDALVKADCFNFWQYHTHVATVGLLMYLWNDDEKDVLIETVCI